jgi:hypothetical protein
MVDIHRMYLKAFWTRIPAPKEKTTVHVNMRPGQFNFRVTAEGVHVKVKALT